MIFERQRDEKIKKIEEGIRLYLPEETGCQKKIWEAVNYSVLAGGKRLRPLFMQESFRLFGGNEEKLIWPFMAAIEMIHTYSLVHDDLPAMDNDDYRRGRLTTHKKFGEDMGILAGDCLLNYAFETAVKSFQCSGKEALVGQALEVLAKKSGGYGMVGGQVVDVLLSGKEMDEDTLLFIHKNKTCALIEASMMVGAILAGATEDEIHTMEEVAECVGMAFQIQDDILDEIGDEAKLGKPIHSDEKNAKMTYLTLAGEEKAKKAVDDYSHKAVQLLEGMNCECTFLKELILSLIRRES